MVEYMDAGTCAAEGLACTAPRGLSPVRWFRNGVYRILVSGVVLARSGAFHQRLHCRLYGECVSSGSLGVAMLFH